MILASGFGRHDRGDLPHQPPDLRGAIGLELTLHLHLPRRSLQRRWADARAGVWMALARFALLNLRSHGADPRNLRPHILVFVGDLTKEDIDVQQNHEEMTSALAGKGLLAFSEVDVARDFEGGVIDAAQFNGIAGLQSNTVLAGGVENNGEMMLMLAHLLSLNIEWSDARIVVRAIAKSGHEKMLQTEGMETLLQEIRIRAETEIITKAPDEAIAEIIRRGSVDADLVFLGLQDPKVGDEASCAERMESLAEGLNTVVFVRSAGEFAGKLI